MHRLDRRQKDKVRSLMQLGCSEPMAIDLLKKMDWQVDAAADRFFMSGGGPAVTVDAAKVEQLFQSYAAKDGGEQIEIAGIEQLCSDLGVDPTDPIMLLIAWQMGCATMCVFTRQEWSRGMTDIGCDTIEGLRDAFPELRSMLDDADSFRDYYTFCFGFAKEPVVGARTLPTEVALQMWQLTLEGRFLHMSEWNEFLAEKKVRAITKDVWDMLLTFVNDVADDMSDYDDEGAWPVLIDEFVEWYREKHGLSAEGMATE